MNTIRIAIKDLEQNVGQIPGLPSNPRQWSKTEIDRIAKSLRETPELFEARPIIVMQWGGKFVILGGNLRYEGCKRNKDKDAPCYIIPDDTPVDKLKEIIIKDNGSFGEWDYDALANLWDDLPLADWGVPAWDTETKVAETDVTEDDFDEDKDMVEQRCKPGEVWELGDHRLMCGDSTKKEDMAKLMDGHRADISFTSPPYNAGSLEISGQDETKRKYGQYDDNKTSSDYIRFLTDNMGLLLDNSEEVFYNIGLVSGNKREIFILINTFIDRFKDIIYWEKDSVAPMIQKGCVNNLVEFIICFGQNNTRRFSHPQFSQGTYWNVIKGKNASDNDYSKIHKATFPVYLPSEIIQNFTDNGASVLDCFGGTGTTMIAAEQLGRKCYMMELDPHYCDVIIARWETFTGKEAKLVSGAGKES